MSVRQQTRRERGREITFWIVDIKYKHSDGTIERVRRVPRVQTKRAAEQMERELLAELSRGRLDAQKEQPPEPQSFEAFSKDFEEIYVIANNKPSEQRTKETLLRVHLRPAFGAKKLDDITALDVEKYKAAKLREGLAPKTINNHLTVLHKIFAQARAWKRASNHLEIQWLNTPEPEFDFFDFDESARLIAAAPEGLWRTMITLALNTGLRQGELLALEWQDIDLVGGRLLVRRNIVGGVIGTPKSGKSREVPLNDFAIAALKSIRSLRKIVFTPPKEDRHLRKNECRRPLYSACRTAGLRQIGWHVLRHSFASQLVMRGAPIKAVQELLGHASMEMTMRYAHLSPETRREAVSLLDPSRGHRGATQRSP